MNGNKLDLNNNITNNPYLNNATTIEQNQHTKSLDASIKQGKKYKILFIIFLILTILYTIYVVYMVYIVKYYNIQYREYLEVINKNQHYKVIDTVNEQSYTSEIMLLDNTVYYKINDSYIEDPNTYELIKYLNDVKMDIPVYDDSFKKIDIVKDTYYKSKLNNVVDMYEVKYSAGKKIFFLCEDGYLYYFNTNQLGPLKDTLFDSHHNLNIRKTDYKNIISIGSYSNNQAYAIDIEGNIYKIG